MEVASGVRRHMADSRQSPHAGEEHSDDGPGPGHAGASAGPTHSDGIARRSAPDLQPERLQAGHLPGDRYVRIVRPRGRPFTREGPDYLVATERVLAPKSALGRAFEELRRIAVGRRIRSELESQERVGKAKGLAVFASDNISSSAYATEEIMRVLVLAGAGPSC